MKCKNCGQSLTVFICDDCGGAQCQECLEEYLSAGIRNGVTEFECPCGTLCGNIPRDIIKDCLTSTDYQMLMDNIQRKLVMCPLCMIMVEKSNVYDSNFKCIICYSNYCSYCYENVDQDVFKRCTCKRYGFTEDIDAVIKEFSDVRKCPVCRILISRDGGCNSMKCIFCKVKFCWSCGSTNAHIMEYGHECDDYGTFHNDDDDLFEYVDGYAQGTYINQ